MYIDKKQLEELIKKHYEETQKFEGDIEAGIEKWRKNADTGYRPRVDLDGYLNFYNKRIRTELTLNEGMVAHIIKIELEKEGYIVDEVKFNCDEKEFGVVEVKTKEKNKGVIDMKNLEMYEGCLIVVDMVNGFVREGVLHDEKIANVIPRQIELIRQAKNEGKLIVFIKDTHDKDAVEFERFGNTKHCVEGDREAELVDELKPFEYLNDIVGCCTDICVANGAIALANLLDEENRKHKIRVHEDAVATYDEDNRKEYVDAAKLLMEQQGIQLVKKGR